MAEDNNILVDWDAFNNNPSQQSMFDSILEAIYKLDQEMIGRPIPEQDIVDIVGRILGTNKVNLYPLDKLEQYRWKGGVTSGGKGFAFPLSTPSRLQVVFTLGKAKGLTDETILNALTIYDNVVAKTGDSRLGMHSLSGIMTELINNDQSGKSMAKQLTSDNVEIFTQSFFANDNPHLSEGMIKNVQRVFNIASGINVSTPAQVAKQIQGGMSYTLIAPEDMFDNWYEAMDQAINEKIENVLFMNNLASGTEAENFKNLAKLIAEVKQTENISGQTRYILNDIFTSNEGADTADIVIKRINSYIKSNPDLTMKGEFPQTINNPDWFKNRSPLTSLLENIENINDEETVKKMVELIEKVAETENLIDDRFMQGKGKFEGSRNYKSPFQIIEEHVESVYNAIDEAVVKVVNGTTTFTPEQLNNEIKILENRLGDVKEFEEMLEVMGPENAYNEYKPLTGQEEVFPYLVLDETGGTPFSYEDIDKAFKESEMFTSLDNIIGQTIIDNEVGRAVIVGVDYGNRNTLGDATIELLFDEDLTWEQAEPRRFMRSAGYSLSADSKLKEAKRKIEEAANYYKRRLDPNVLDLSREFSETEPFAGYNVQTGKTEVETIKRSQQSWKVTETEVPGGTVKNTDTYTNNTVKRPLEDFFIQDMNGYHIIDNQGTKYGFFNGDANLSVAEMSDAEMQLQDLQKKETQQFLNEITDDNITDIREKQLDKLLSEAADEESISNLTPSQTELIDNALDDAAAKLNRSTFKVVEGGKRYTMNEVLNAAGKRLGKIFVDGITLLDIYELGLLAYAFGEPVVDMITKVIYPDLVDDASYKEKLFANIEMTAKYSPTEKLITKIGDEYEYITGVRPGEVFDEVTSDDTSPVRPVLPTGKDEGISSTKMKEIEEAFDYDMSRFKNQEGTNPEEYNQFLKGMHGILGGNNG